MQLLETVKLNVYLLIINSRMAVPIFFFDNNMLIISFNQTLIKHEMMRAIDANKK